MKETQGDLIIKLLWLIASILFYKNVSREARIPVSILERQFTDIRDKYFKGG